jgi:integrase
MVGSNRRDAELVRAKTQSDLLLGKHGIPTSSAKSLPLADLIKAFLNKKKSRIKGSSLTRYGNYYTRLQAFFDNVFPTAASDIQRIELQYLEEFLDAAMNPTRQGEKGWSEGTANDSVRAIRALFTYAVEQKYVKENPAAMLEGVRERSRGKADFYSDEELSRIWEKLDPHWVDPLKFISETGLRKGELISLKWDAVNMSAGQEQITVESTNDFETKTGNSRSIPLTVAAIEILKKRQGQGAGLVFTSKEGKTIHPDKIYHALKTTLAELGLEGDVHRLRHTYASRLAMKGVDLLSIKTLMGHTDLKTTQIYAHLAPQHLRDVVKVLNPSETKMA